MHQPGNRAAGSGGHCRRRGRLRDAELAVESAMTPAAIARRGEIRQVGSRRTVARSIIPPARSELRNLPGQSVRRNTNSKASGAIRGRATWWMLALEREVVLEPAPRMSLAALPERRECDVETFRR